MPAKNRVFFILLGFLIRQPFWMAFSILLSSLAILFGVGLIGTSAYLITYAALMPSIAVLQVSIVGVRFFGLAKSLFRYLERLASHSVNFQMLTRLRGWLFRQYSDQFPASLAKTSATDTLSSLMEDVETLEFYFIRVINPPLTAIFTGLVCSILLYGFHPRLMTVFAICFLASILICLTGSYLLTRAASARHIHNRANLHRRLAEFINGLPDLTVNQSHTSWLNQIRASEIDYQQGEIRIALSTGISNAMIVLLTQGSMLAVLLTAASLVQDGAMDGILLAASALIALAAFDAVQPLSLTSQQTILTQQAGSRLELPASSLPEVSENKSYDSTLPELRQIQLANLSFQIEPRQNFSLQSINLEWHAPDWIALVGPSGAGKTTLAKLLLAYWKRYTGQICYNGALQTTLSPEWIRSQIAYSGQAPYFINGTLRENLLISNPECADEVLIATLEDCQLMEWFAGLPLGLDSPLGERGIKLSEGERRRLDIARAILRDTPFLIFDEPLSGLDSITENALLTSLRQRLKMKGVLWITHRISGLAFMDQILVLDQGTIQQQGLFADLCKTDGLFKMMLDTQNRIIQ